MKHQWITNNGNTRLIMIFAGWGMDDRPFANLEKQGYDIVVLWDYRDDHIDVGNLSRYDDVCVFAWSFGVYGASRLLGTLGLPISLKVAINGTMFPIHDDKGIPQRIFSGTLDGLDDRNLLKFYRRMCASQSQFERFKASMPQRDVDELKAELARFAEIARQPSPKMNWDIVVMGDKDAIIPYANQQQAWQGHPYTIVLQGEGHLPCWRTIFDKILIDKHLVARQFAKSAPTYETNATIQRSVAIRLWELWQNNYPKSQKAIDILEIGYGTGFLTQLYVNEIAISSLTLWDLVPQPLDALPANVTIQCRDGETALRQRPDSSIDVIASASTIQWFNALSSFMEEAQRVLRQDGLLVLSTFGPGTFKEIEQVTGKSLHYYSLQQLLSIIPKGFTTLCIEEGEIRQTFGNPMQALRHIKAIGGNSLSSTDTSIKMVNKILHEYPKSASGDIALTYHPIYLILRKQNKEL